MPRAALRLALAAMLAGIPASAGQPDPHLDPESVPESCSACHRGHGASRSPMLPKPQLEVCLDCHGSQSQRDRTLAKDRPSLETPPRLLESVLSRSFTHPLTDTAFSRHEPDAVTCTSCHSPHRASVTFKTGPTSPGSPKPSPRNPAQSEFELCTGCHGGGRSGRSRGSRSERRFESSNRSLHPMEAPSGGNSPSVLPELVGRQVNCTDCHGSNEPADARGPHGSNVRFLLRDEYTTVDGSSESPSLYALCYRCHDRQRVLDSIDFPEHRSHVVDHRASCATCHDPHGSIENRALIRFDDFEVASGVSASGITGRLAFESTGSGSGACYLTCHGYDHAPATYGAVFAPVEEQGGAGSRGVPDLPAKLPPPE